MSKLNRGSNTVETFPVVGGVPLRLSFTPSAIREHFDGDEDDPLAGLSETELLQIGSLALCDDLLYKAFHEVLVECVEYVREQKA